MATKADSIAGFWSLVLLYAALVGCDTPPGSEPTIENGPETERMIEIYGDPAAQRVRVLADFETAQQQSLFHLVPAGHGVQATITTEQAVAETGVGSLRMPLLYTGHRVVAVETPDSQWALHRDWSGYQLLLLKVYSPRKLGSFRFSVTSGTDSPMTYQQGNTLLEQGWNEIRLDLGELRDRIDLGDVRQMSFWCEPLDTPTDLYLDDLVLIDNTEQLFGRRDAADGELYVLRQGRRLVVGSVGRFELVFLQGRIMQWYDLASDPGGARNLLGLGTLGPTPVVLTDNPHAQIVIDDPQQWAGLGIAAAVEQSLVESTPIRVTLKSRWEFGLPDEPGDAARPCHQWTYTIYRDGRVFVRCEGVYRTEAFAAPGVGLVFTCDGDMGFGRHIVLSSTGDHPVPPYALFNRAARSASDLLIVPSEALQVRPLEDPGSSQRIVLIVPPTQDNIFSFNGLIRVYPSELDTPAQAQPMADDFRHPLPLEIDAGSLIRIDEGDENNDGYNETYGCYVIRLDGNTGRLRMDGKKCMRFSPILKVVDVAGRDIWAYVDGRPIRRVHRDPGDEWLLIEVPGVIADEALIEIHARERPNREE